MPQVQCKGEGRSVSQSSGAGPWRRGEKVWITGNMKQARHLGGFELCGGNGPLRNSRRFECGSSPGPFQPNCQRFKADSKRSHGTRLSTRDFQSDQLDERGGAADVDHTPLLHGVQHHCTRHCSLDRDALMEAYCRAPTVAAHLVGKIICARCQPDHIHPIGDCSCEIMRGAHRWWRVSRGDGRDGRWHRGLARRQRWQPRGRSSRWMRWWQRRHRRRRRQWR